MNLPSVECHAVAQAQGEQYFWSYFQSVVPIKAFLDKE